MKRKRSNPRLKATQRRAMANLPSLSLYILTFNCGRDFIEVDAFASQLFNGLSQKILPDILVLSLQEIAPVPQSLIGGSFLVPYFARFHQAVQKAAQELSDEEPITSSHQAGHKAARQISVGDGPIYTSVAARNLGMVGIMIFARDPDSIKDLETGGIGTGAAEMGNKGAVGARFTYQQESLSTELTFVAAHLAAMEDQVQRRNEDWMNIVRGLVFTSSAMERGNTTSLSGEERPLLSISPHDAGIYKPTSHLFVAGDLNYRTSIMSPSPTDHAEAFPQPHHNTSSPQHISALFENDQLNQERLAGRTCHGLTEAQITFPPTYKYNPTEPFLTPDEELTKWHWATHRWPSWCDRILFLKMPTWVKSPNPNAKISINKYSALPLFPFSDHRAVALEVSVPLIAIPRPDEEEESENKDPRIHPPFEIDINWKSKRSRARMFELITGFTGYFTTTAEGGGAVVAMVVGAVGLSYVIRALLL